MLKCVDSIMIDTEICPVYICDHTGEITARETAERTERERENERKRRKSERQRVAEKGFGVRYKFNSWSNFSGLKTDNPCELISGLSR